MFEDIIGSENTKEKFINAFNKGKCPKCNHRNPQFLSGVFKSSINYWQLVICLGCFVKWEVTYNESLDIIDIKESTEK